MKRKWLKALLILMMMMAGSSLMGPMNPREIEEIVGRGTGRSPPKRSIVAPGRMVVPFPGKDCFEHILARW
jgi:hypothetical protein